MWNVAVVWNVEKTLDRQQQSKVGNATVVNNEVLRQKQQSCKKEHVVNILNTQKIMYNYVCVREIREHVIVNSHM